MRKLTFKKNKKIDKYKGFIKIKEKIHLKKNVKKTLETFGKRTVQDKKIRGGQKNFSVWVIIFLYMTISFGNNIR